MGRSRRFSILVTAIVLGVIAAPLAGQGRGPGARPVGADGVVQIDQQAVRNGGISANDAPGFPALLSEPGSYRLTGNLSLTEAEAGHLADGIVISVPGVTLDLNGFIISGYNACSGNPPDEEVTCTYEGIFSGNGIVALQAATIRDGTVRSMTYHGVLCHHGCHVENVRALENLVGISTGGRSVVRNNVAEWNGAGGISTNLGRTGSAVENNVASLNGGSAGFFLGMDDSVRGNTASRNSGIGIFSNGGTLVNNNASHNGLFGIAILRGAVLENTMYANARAGLQGGRAVAYGGNTILTRRSDHPGAMTVFGNPVQVSSNVCGDELDLADAPSTTCP